MTLIQTVDPGGETPDWRGQIGFVPAVLEKAAPASADTIAIVCGPPIMLKFTWASRARASTRRWRTA